MPLAALIVPDEIRACLGVDPSDIPDAYIENSLFSDSLEIDLLDWLPGYKSLLESELAEHVLTQKALRMYVRWYCASELASRQLTFLLNKTDGKAAASRFSVDLHSVYVHANDQANKYKKVVLGGQPSGTPSIMGVSSPGVDPVTMVVPL